MSVDNGEKIEQRFFIGQNNVSRFDEYGIEFFVERQAEPFTKTHIKKMKPVLEFFDTIDPMLTRLFSEVRSTHAPNAILHDRFPLNGRNVTAADGEHAVIILYNRGMNLELPHRIASGDIGTPGFVDNFSGTLAHELTHGGGRTGATLFPDVAFNRNFLVEWQKKFGWGQIFPNIKNTQGAWEKSNIPQVGWNKNLEGYWYKEDYVIVGENFTTMPEKCIGGVTGYAASTDYFEDICDSVAAFVLNPEILNEEKRDFIAQKIREYKQNI